MYKKGRNSMVMDDRARLNEALTDFAINSGAKLKAHLTRLLGPNLCEDVYQQTFENVLNAMPTAVVREGAVDNYVWRAALRLADKTNIKEARFGTSELPVEDHDIAGAIDIPETTSEANRTLSVVGEALGSLPAEKRKVFLMRTVGGMRVKDISKQMGMTYQNTRYHINDAVGKFTNKLNLIEEGKVCESYKRLLAESVYGSVETGDSLKLSLHLSHCSSCRSRRREFVGKREAVAALVPAPLAFALVVKGAVSIGVGTASATKASLLSGAVAKTAVVATSAIVISAGTYAVVKAVDKASPTKAGTVAKFRTKPAAIPAISKHEDRRGLKKKRHKAKDKRSPAPVQQSPSSSTPVVSSNASATPSQSSQVNNNPADLEYGTK